MRNICGTVRENSSGFRDHAHEKFDLLPFVSGLALKECSRMKIITTVIDAKENIFRGSYHFCKLDRIEVSPSSGVDAMRANIGPVVSLQ
jgi:hypothetical protein